jgi:hypothetical protein
MVYVPEKGETVRVLEIAEWDANPRVAVGDVVEVKHACEASDGYILLTTSTREGDFGTYCRVEPYAEPAGVAAAMTAYAVHAEKQRVEGLLTTDGAAVPLIPEPPFLSTDSATRKRMPVATGVLLYFPDALLCVSWVSRAGNDKHNPGEPLHWDKSKSADEKDAEVRHMLDAFRGLPPDPGLEPLSHLGHLASKAWRALADLQRACDAAREAHERGEEWRK